MQINMLAKRFLFALALSSSALAASAATCVFDLQSVPAGKNSALEADSIRPIISEGRVSGVSINGQTFSIARDAEGNIVGTIDSSGAMQTLPTDPQFAITPDSKKADGSGSVDWSGDPCYSMGGSIEFDIFNHAENKLDRVEIVGESVKRVESWFPVLQKPFPSDQELIAEYGSKDQIQECRGRLYACLDCIAGIDSTNLGTCVSAAAIAAQKGLWSAAAVFAACVAGKDKAKEEKTNACWAAYATCSLKNP